MRHTHGDRKPIDEQAARAVSRLLYFIARVVPHALGRFVVEVIDVVIGRYFFLRGSEASSECACHCSFRFSSFQTIREDPHPPVRRERGFETLSCNPEELLREAPIQSVEMRLLN